MASENENMNLRQCSGQQRNYYQDRSKSQFSTMLEGESKKRSSDFNIRLNAEYVNENGQAQGQLRGNGQRKPKQYNNRVYKPTPKETKRVTDSPYVIHLNSNDMELCKANISRLQNMHRNTPHNSQLERHLDMIAKGTDYFLSQQQLNVIKFHEDLRRYQESIVMNR